MPVANEGKQNLGFQMLRDDKPASCVRVDHPKSTPPPSLKRTASVSTENQCLEDEIGAILAYFQRNIF